MKKLVTIILSIGMAALLCACGNKTAESATESGDTNYDIIGTWTQIDSENEYYFVLNLREDGSGNLMTEPDDIGLPLAYEVDGTSIMTHMGSADDNSPMEYLPDSDQIQYGDIYFARGRK